MKNGENYSRRRFVKNIAAAVILSPLLQFCKNETAKLLVRLTGTRHILGHRLWAKDFPKPVRTIEIPYLIIGGGISGLSAAREFHRKGISDFLMVELEDHLGGNASNGENRYSKFPLGAHYLPLPNFHDRELLQFLEESKIITGYDPAGFPVFDETQMAIAPEERLFYKNAWQEGLVPKTGNTMEEDRDFNDFFTRMDTFRKLRGEDGRYAFDIPVSQSSEASEIRELDKISMQQWLRQNGFGSKAFFDYIDYCCRDDFGLGADLVSAWAGIHYFAARKHDATSDKKESVLTWPEGNARLAAHLKKYTAGKTLKNHLAYRIGLIDGKVVAEVFDDKKKESVKIIADKALMATPQFINGYLIAERKNAANDFHYVPWLLATLTVSNLSDNNSFPLCWDNVIYGSKGLGYVYDQNQSLGQLHPEKVITYYYSFSSPDLKKTRKEIYRKKEDYWKQLVFEDLRIAHPEIESVTREMRLHLIGHAMISPVPGFLFGQARKKASENIGGKIFFAHSDLSGISIFEEAFHQGINAVNQMTHGTTLDS